MLMAAFDTGRRLAALEREHTPDKVTRIIIQGAGKPDGPAATMQQQPDGTWINTKEPKE